MNVKINYFQCNFIQDTVYFHSQGYLLLGSQLIRKNSLDRS